VRKNLAVGYFVDAALAYRPTKQTTILFATTSEICRDHHSGPLRHFATRCDCPGRAAARSTARSHLQDTYGQDHFFGSPRVDNRFFVSAGLTWKFSRMLQFNAELRQEWLHSNVLVVNNTATVATVGARIQY
jgi:hypothetical protein